MQNDQVHMAGYLTYEAGLALEDRLAPIAKRRDEGATPLLWFGIFDGVQLIAPDDLPALLSKPDRVTIGAVRALLNEPEYRDVFGIVQSGDAYQVNLTFPCEVDVAGDMAAVYAAIRPHAAAGYGGMIADGRRTILSFSPELFFQQAGGQLTAFNGSIRHVIGFQFRPPFAAERFLIEATEDAWRSGKPPATACAQQALL